MKRKTKIILVSIVMLFFAFSCKKQDSLSNKYNTPNRLRITSTELIEIVNNKNNRQYHSNLQNRHQYSPIILLNEESNENKILSYLPFRKTASKGNLKNNF